METTRRMLIGGALAMTQAPTLLRAKPVRKYRRIATEEGYLSPAVLAQNAKTNLPGVPLITLDGPASGLATALVDVGEGRIAAMDRDGIDMQLLMLSSPGVQVFERDIAVALAADANDFVAQACRKYPTRLAALAAIAPQDPNAAARELERATGKLGLKGGIINSHTFDAYLDQQRFWPIFEAAEALNVPIYIHPREPATGMREIMTGPVVGGAAWAYGVEVGTHILKLIGAGVFDRFPKLRIVVGHMGEALPFWLPRIDNRYMTQAANRRPIKRLPSDYIRENIWITTSGMNYWPQLRMALEVMGPDRVLYATDYPFEVQGEAVRFVEDMPLDERAKKQFFEDNAVAVFRL